MRDVREGRTLPVPKHLRDSHYQGAKRLGHGEGYQYSHDFPGGIVEQDYLGVDKIYYDPEIQSLQTSMTTSNAGVREPVSGQPMPVNLIDLVIVPGLGFTTDGHRIGRGMGFYDRFLAQPEFVGLSCGYGFEEQVIERVPVLDHDMSLSMLCTDRGIRRFAANCMIQQ
jgi:hypothetical protein